MGSSVLVLPMSPIFWHWKKLYFEFLCCQDSPDQWPMSINKDQCRIKLCYWSQCRSKRSMAINADQCRDNLIGIDQHWSFWSALGSIAQFLLALIGIDQHWPLIGGVLTTQKFKFRRGHNFIQCQNIGDIGRTRTEDPTCLGHLNIYLALYTLQANPPSF